MFVNDQKVRRENSEKVFKKVQEICKNAQELVNESNKTFTTSITDIDEIELDLSIASDEFYIKDSKANKGVLVEVVDKDAAESNDKDFVNLGNGYTQEEIDTYEVGGYSLRLFSTRR